jgi:hypothetical protein
MRGPVNLQSLHWVGYQRVWHGRNPLEPYDLVPRMMLPKYDVYRVNEQRCERGRSDLGKESGEFDF